MGYSARILADSITRSGTRLTTLEAVIPRIVLAELNTHRTHSRCSASSRAIPVEKRIEMIERDPFIPETFGKNRKGMQSTEDLDDEAASQARLIWTNAKTDAIARARELAKLEVHKQLANRLLEPFAWHTVVLSATEWENFYALRCHPDAQGEMRRSAEFMQEAMHNSTPRLLEDGEWHLPYITEEERLTFELEFLIKVSCGRCARVSYRTFDGKYDPHADYILAEKLAEAGHMSPLEHPARPMTSLELETYQTFKLDENKRVVPAGSFCGNFRDWIQARKRIRFEHNFALHQTQAQGEVSA